MLWINRRGQLRAIYSPLVADIATAVGGEISIRRASHVEPWSELSDAAKQAVPPDARTASSVAWYVDLTPVSGPVLGPFTTREAALEIEKAWLFAQAVPTPEEI